MAIMLFGIFGLTACYNVSLADYRAKGKASIDAHVATKAQSDYTTEKWTDILSIAAVGKRAIDDATNKGAVDMEVEKTKEAIDLGYYEIEVDDMVDCSLFRYDVAMSWIGVPITLSYPNENAVFECLIDRGSFSYNQQENTAVIKPSGGFHWCPYERSSDGEILATWEEKAFVDIILRVENHIIGFAIVEIYPNGPLGHNFLAKLLKSALFPKIEDKFQEIPEVHIKNIFENFKGGI